MSDRPGIAVIGHLSLDHHVSVEAIPGPDADVLVRRYESLPGGAAANVAAAASIGGLVVSLLSGIGTDDVGGDLVEDIGRYGVVTDLIAVHATHRTSQLLVIKDPAGHRSWYLDPSGASFVPMGPALTTAAERHGAVAYVGCPLTMAIEAVGTWPELSHLANIGFWIASGEIEQVDAPWLARHRAIFANRDEWSRLAPRVRSELETTGAGPLVVITDGPRPTQLIHDGAATWVDVPPVDQVVDTIGCGDAFMGSFLARWSRGDAPSAACAFAHLAAAEIAGSRSERSLTVADLWT